MHELALGMYVYVCIRVNGGTSGMFLFTHGTGHVIPEGLHCLCQIIHPAISVRGGRPGSDPGLCWLV